MSRDLDLDAVFGSSSPAETFAAVLTEARMVLGEIGSPLDAELWGSDILAALGGPKGNAAIAIVLAAEATGTAEALAILRVMAAVGWPHRALKHRALKHRALKHRALKHRALKHRALTSRRGGP